jgi:HK97 gp10 family phage protein
MDVTWSLHGADELRRRLQSVGDEKRVKKIARAAARKGMNVVRDAARAGARAIDDPASPEIVAKNIVTQESARAGRREGGIVMRVGVMGGANPRSPGGGVQSLPGRDTRHWRYLEFGTEDTPAQPFMRRALESNAQRVGDVVLQELARGLDKVGA